MRERKGEAERETETERKEGMKREREHHKREHDTVIVDLVMFVRHPGFHLSKSSNHGKTCLEGR